MKTLVIIAVAVAGLIFIGWMTFANSKDQATITIDKQKVQRDTEEAVETTKDALNTVKEETKELIDETDEALNDVKEETTEAVEEFNEPEPEVPSDQPENQDEREKTTSSN